MNETAKPSSLKARLEAALLRIWYKNERPPLPATWLLSSLEAVHRLYRKASGVEQSTSQRADHSLDSTTSRPLVLVVGNLIAGGAGKTPIVKAVCREMTQKGFKVGVISRGYGRESALVTVIRPGDRPDASEVGDEPLWLLQETDCPVAVGQKRAEALTALVQAVPDLDLVVSDDGLQHHALSRHFEWVVFDDRAAGNGRLLPAGPLREPLTRLKSVDAVLCAGLSVQSLADKLSRSAQPHWHEVANRLTGFVNLGTGEHMAFAEALDHFASKSVMAFTGLGNPDKFFKALSLQGLGVDETLPLPDHYDYPDGFLKGLRAEVLLTTGKDAVKLGTSDNRVWVAEIETTLPRQPIEQLEAQLGLSTHRHHGLPDLQGQSDQKA